MPDVSTRELSEVSSFVAFSPGSEGDLDLLLNKVLGPFKKSEKLLL
jgi:hypothetical protein